MKFNFHVEEGNFIKAGQAAAEIKKILKQLNLNNSLIRRVVISMYEAEVNVVAHAKDGDIEVDIQPNGVSIIVKDRGPGILDVKKAMEEGFSTASAKVREMGFGAGMGLPNIKKNSDILEIDTTPGEGTVLKIVINF
ncbi:MAG: ATP-binding protein [Candidatus Delongbacteria bacterium]|nr:ATP-binding protein [Candidatus Delongbacteria bacterium]MBN2834945.1 ATP-binding protein [Candidatus Delongbacteria bacterium]